MLPSGPGDSPFATRDSVRQLCSWNSRTSTKASARRGARRVVVERAGLEREPQQLLEQLDVDDELARVHAALVGERRVGDAPALVLRADELVVGDEHVGEEHLVELGLVGDLAQRPHLDARARACRRRRHEMPCCFGTSGLVRARHRPQSANCA